MTQPTISVVIPAHNASDYIEAALGSVAAQTVKTHEVIVVDDASTDRTAELARALQARVRRNERSRFASGARNVGIAEATGDLVAFLDADDLWEPDHLALSLRHFSDHRVVFSCSGCRCFGASDRLLELPWPDGILTDVRDRLWRDNFLNQSSVVARRAAVIEAGAYDESLRISEDYDLWMRLAARGSLGVTRTVTVRRRMHADQTTASASVFPTAWEVRRREAVRRISSTGVDDRASLSAHLRDAMRNDLDVAIWAGRKDMVDELRVAAAHVEETVPGVQLADILGAHSPSARVAIATRLFARRALSVLRAR